MNNITKLNNLFLQQSVLDAWEDYQRSLNKIHFITWDYVILTASNEEQASAYQIQLDSRMKQGLLPSGTKYVVLPDPNGKRVGSGGATLNVLRYISEDCGNVDCFSGKRILVIHSGGDSKRVPQYSACGKLFSPVPRQLPDGRRSTLFDEFIITMSGVPSRLRDGMLVLSGDVLLLFNPLQIDFQTEGAAAISMKEPVSIGKNHGVFLGDGEGNVANFLHKMSEQELTDIGAVNAQGNVDLDTGAILMDSRLLSALFGLICTNEILDPHKFAEFVNDRVRLSFYGDFLYPLATRSTIEKYYRENPEGVFCEELTICRTKLWEALHPYRMKLICLSPAQFIHFGTTRELLELMTDEIENYSFLGWERQVLTNRNRNKNFACNNAYIEESVTLHDRCYIEDSYLYGDTVIEEGCVISNVILRDVHIPSYVTMHGLQLENGKYVVRVYGTLDNPKWQYKEQMKFLGVDFDGFVDEHQIPTKRLWIHEGYHLWQAMLYPVCDTMEEAVDWALALIDIFRHGNTLPDLWLSTVRMSLCDSFNFADVRAILPWQDRLDLSIRRANFITAVQQQKTVEEAIRCFGAMGIGGDSVEYLKEYALGAEFSVKIRIYYYLSRLTKGSVSEELENLCFDSIRNGLTKELTGQITYLDQASIQKDQVLIELPIRVNFGGGWSDTPPYCNERGGSVLNVAATLKNRYPVVVELRRIEKPVITLASTDSGAYQEFSQLSELQNCSNPFDPFALHKAALLAFGLVPMPDQGTEISLSDIIRHLGGGMYLSTQVMDVPRGSGLGTSSILAGACIKGLYEFFGMALDQEELYAKVIVMEQIMSTGGGWQDQVGGLSSGIKFITSTPGLQQELKVTWLKLAHETKQELQERFALIYTGQRRLARNLLREVVGRYLASNANSIEVLYEIQRYATLMRFELEKGNVDAFAKLMDEHWELSQRLDQGCTNTCIDQIFLTCEDLLAGKMICGAGGGGFLQVVLKKGITKHHLRNRIREVFQDSGVDVWDCELLFE